MAITMKCVIPPCASCGGPRTNVATSDGETPLWSCTTCGEIESPLVGVVPASDTPAEDALVPPPQEEDELLPPPQPDDPEAPDGRTSSAPHAPLVSSPSVPNGGGIGTALQPLMEILPADFPLPVLIRFAPDVRVRTAADEDAAKLLALNPTNEIERDVAERALAHQREHVKTIEALFEQAADTAFKLHRHITSTRGEWASASVQAIKAVGDRIVALTRRLQREEDERRRRAQEEADRQAREAARKAADEAKRAQAPAPVVQELEREAETATAPPVSTPSLFGGGSGLSRSTVAQKWESRLTATDRAAVNRHPKMADLSEAERQCVLKAMKAVLEGRNPITLFEINWSVADQRASSDKKAFAIDGFLAEDVGSLRAKPGARK